MNDNHDFGTPFPFLFTRRPRLPQLMSNADTPVIGTGFSDLKSHTLTRRM